MNYRLISKALGLLLLLLGVTMGICLGVEGTAHWSSASFRALAISLGITVGVGVFLLVLGRGSGTDMLRKESIAIVSLGWLACGLFGALPYVFCEPSVSLARGFFEAVSGFTTTGASIIDDLTQYDRAILLWRSSTQWLGGMGILVLFVAVLSYFKLGGKSLFQHESSVEREHSTFTSIRDTAASLWKAYIVMTLVCILGLWLLGMTPYEAVNHAFATLSTGGFSTENASLAAYSSAIQLWVILFMIIGSLSFLLYPRWAANPKTLLRKDEPTVYFLSIVAVTTLAIALARFADGDHAPIPQVLLGSAFQVTSIISTTGFASEDYAQWNSLSQMLLLTIMFIGGCAGSTAGGLKVNRFISVYRILREELTRYYRPRIVLRMPELHRGGGAGRRRQILIIFVLAWLVTGLGTLLVCAFEPRLSPMGAISGVVSCMMNVGPALAELGPTHNYSGLHGHTLVLLSFLMILGRLEFLALVVLLSRHFWKRY